MAAIEFSKRFLIKERKKGLNVLFKTLGESDAIRFLSQIRYEKRNYLRFQEELFEGMTVDEIYRNAKAYFEKKRCND
ncbi:MAG: hypothetical protein AB1630_03095 [bacterium]